MKPEIQKLIEYSEQKKLINSDICFSVEEIFELRKRKLIYASLVQFIGNGNYSVESNCKNCGCSNTWVFTKKELIKYIRDETYQCICEECYEEENAEKNKLIIENNTKYFLSTDEKYDKINNLQTAWSALINGFVNEELLATELCKLNYNVFLLTRYWQTISRNLRKTTKKCEKCGSEENLQVHHDTYEHHGKEHLFLNDLKVLCKNCHDIIHLPSRIDTTMIEEKLCKLEINENTSELEQEYINEYGVFDFFDEI